MTKSIVSLISFMLIFVLLFTACSNGNNGNNSSSTEKANDKAAETAATTPEPELNINPAGVFPIVKEKVTLKVMIVNHGAVENFNTNEFTKRLEEKTNVHLEFEEVPAAQADEKLNITLASGTYPDIIMNFNLKPAQLIVYGEQGIFLPLNDMIEKYGHEINNFFEKRPDVKSNISAPNGNIYALPALSECYHCAISQKMWINKAWLEKLKLDMPTTPEELMTVLRAFKNDDPNGNGKQDEIPLTGAITGFKTNIDGFIMNAFTYYHRHEYNYGLAINDNGKLEASFTNPEFKDGLKYYRDLYKEGLIAPESFTQTIAQLKQLVENKDFELVGAVTAGAVSAFSQVGGERWLQYEAVPPLKGPTGLQIAPYDPIGTFNIGKFIITSTSKHPEVAFRVGEMFYNEQTMLEARFGKEGEGWERAKSGEIGSSGEQAVIKVNSIFGDLHNAHWGNSAPDYMPGKIQDGQVVENPSGNLASILHKETKTKYLPYQQSVDKLLPPLWFSEEQAAKVVEYDTTIFSAHQMKGYVAESFARFVTGDLDVDKDWDNYLKSLEQMKLPAYIAIFQEAYDAYKANNK